MLRHPSTLFDFRNLVRLQVTQAAFMGSSRLHQVIHGCWRLLWNSFGRQAFAVPILAQL